MAWYVNEDLGELLNGEPKEVVYADSYGQIVKSHKELLEEFEYELKEFLTKGDEITYEVEEGTMQPDEAKDEIQFGYDILEEHQALTLNPELGKDQGIGLDKDLIEGWKLGLFELVDQVYADYQKTPAAQKEKTRRYVTTQIQEVPAEPRKGYTLSATGLLTLVGCALTYLGVTDPTWFFVLAGGTVAAAKGINTYEKIKSDIEEFESCG